MTKNKIAMAAVGILSLMGGSAITSGGEFEACELSAHHAHTSCKQGVIADYWLSVARCDNLPARAERQACMAQASQDRVAARTECKARFHVREEICEELGDEPYHPEIDPEEFETEIDNTFLPWIPGTTFIYEGTTARGVEHIEVVVSHETRVIQGVECVQVRDTVSLNGDVIEDTLDWYAQDDDDNVWYFGESVQDFEDGFVSSLSGSFMAGVNGAKAGIAMKTAPQIGDFYRQEFDIDNAEDVARVLSVTETVTVPFGTFTNCLKNKEFSPTGPGQFEYKYYAAGIGLVLIVDAETGHRLELVGITHEDDGDRIPLKEAKLNIEHNATAEDTGFQGAIDSEGWERLDVTGPEGIVLTLEGRGTLRTLGLTELFFETVEPANVDVPIEDMLAMLPEGEYTIAGTTPDGGRTEGLALLTHNIPAGPILQTPAEGATVPASNLVMSWDPVTQTITGENVTIISYQLIVEKDEPVHPHAIGKRGLSIYVPPSVTSVTVPDEFLELGTHYLWEVLAIEESGNQTLSSSDFTTQ